MSNSTSLPVIILGAGPAGLTAALLLARQGIKVQVLERHPTLSIHPRARGLNVRTMEIYRGVHLEAPIIQAGEALATSKYMLFVETLAGQEIRRVPDDDLVATGEALATYTPCTWVQCAQDELEPLLLKAALHYGASIQFHNVGKVLAQDHHGVTLEIRDVETGTIQVTLARYVIAADGAKGDVRQSLGIPLIEQAVQGHYVNIYFRADLRKYVQGREFALCFVENADAPGIILAVNNTDRWLFNAEYDPTTTSPETFTLNRCIEVVRTATGIADLPVEILSVLPWEATARCAGQMQKGRVFLMGDAAHTMPPAGGFGLNTGVADAHNLAWKLALVLQDKASPALLTTYETERLPVAKQVVERAIQELTAERPDMPPSDEDSVLLPILGFSYDSHAVLSDGTSAEHGLDLQGRPGTRLPHIWLERSNERLSTLDLIDNHFVFLTGPEGEQWLLAVQHVSEQCQVVIKGYQIGGQGELHDLTNSWCTANGIGKNGAILVRPDGIVAWRARQLVDDTAAALTSALTHILRKTMLD